MIHTERSTGSTKGGMSWPEDSTCTEAGCGSGMMSWSLCLTSTATINDPLASGICLVGMPRPPTPQAPCNTHLYPQATSRHAAYYTHMSSTPLTHLSYPSTIRHSTPTKSVAPRPNTDMAQVQYRHASYTGQTLRHMPSSTIHTHALHTPQALHTPHRTHTPSAP